MHLQLHRCVKKSDVKKVFSLFRKFLKLLKMLIPTSALPIRESEPPLLDSSVGSLNEDILDAEFVCLMKFFN